MLKSLAMALLLVAALPAFADDTPLQRLNNFLAKASSLQADFRQVVISEKGEAGKASSGEFYLQRPGKFRWVTANSVSMRMAPDCRRSGEIRCPIGAGIRFRCPRAGRRIVFLQRALFNRAATKERMYFRRTRKPFALGCLTIHT